MASNRPRPGKTLTCVTAEGCFRMLNKKSWILVLVCLLACIQPMICSAEIGEVRPVPDRIRSEFELAPFYQKHIDVGGLPVVGSEQVSDAALHAYALALARAGRLSRGIEVLLPLLDSDEEALSMAVEQFLFNDQSHGLLDLLERLRAERPQSVTALLALAKGHLVQGARRVTSEQGKKGAENQDRQQVPHDGLLGYLLHRIPAPIRGRTG